MFDCVCCRISECVVMCELYDYLCIVRCLKFESYSEFVIGGLVLECECVYRCVWVCLCVRDEYVFMDVGECVLVWVGR